MKKKEITYPFHAVDGLGGCYVFNKSGEKIELVLPDGDKQLVEGDELTTITKTFKQYQLKLLVSRQLVEILRPSNDVLAYTILFGKGSIIQIADTSGNVYESRGKFRFVRTDTYKVSGSLPEDREYLIDHLLATYTEGMHPNSTDNVTDMNE